MRILNLGIICFVLVAFALGQAKASSFIEGMEDIPLMKGLKQIESEDIAFGNEESRLIEVYVSGKKNFTQVEKFYKDTLPQLGWTFKSKKKDILSFYRDMDIVEIAKEKNKPLIVRITLKSRG